MSPVEMVLVLSGVLPPREAGAVLPARPQANVSSRSQPAPGLARLLRAAGVPQHEADGTGAALASLHGVARQADWPLAAIVIAALGVDPGEHFWLAADPVTLEPGRDDVRLTGAVTDLNAAEAAALIATLNAHFAGDGLRFVAPRPDSWFVSAPTTQQIVTRPLEAATGRTLRTLLADGADASRWRRWQNEIQMLLHEHPVNVARSDEGRAVANSLWFSGGGRWTSPASANVRTYANRGIAAALAHAGGEPARRVPTALDTVLADLADGRPRDCVVVALEPPHDLSALDRAWTAPAWTALAQRRLAGVTLIADGGGCTVRWNARRPGAMQRLRGRWRTPEATALIAAAGAVCVHAP